MVTVVGLYDGREYKAFVEGDNLQDLPAHLQNYSLVVYVQRSRIRSAVFEVGISKLGTSADPHRSALEHTEIRNEGRSQINRGELGLKRSASVESLTGYDATVLWAKYLRGERARSNS